MERPVERVTFLVERTGDRISCLLNPESLEVRRAAGVQRRLGAGGAVLGTLRGDDPLIAVGGGSTEYDLHLLFDVEIAMEGRPAAPADPVPLPADVRSLTQPLWALAETAKDPASGTAPPRMRFIWGKSWNVPAVVIAAAERLDRFDASGVPQRSWLSLRLRRVDEDGEPGSPPPVPVTPQFELGLPPAALPAGDYEVVPMILDDAGMPLDRIDLIASDHLGDPGYMRALAELSGIDDMFRVPPGTMIRLPASAQMAAWDRQA
jgi:hypothetical protein